MSIISSTKDSFIIQPNLNNLFLKNEAADKTPPINKKIIKDYFVGNSLEFETKPDFSKITTFRPSFKTTTFKATTLKPIITSTIGLLNHISTTDRDYSKLATSTSAPLTPSARTLISFEAVLTGLVYLSFGIFLFRMIQKHLDTKKTEDLLTYLEGRAVSSFGSYYDMAANVISSIEQAPEKTISKTVQAIESYKIAKEKPECLPLFLCLRKIADDKKDQDMFFSAAGIGLGVWNAMWNPYEAMNNVMASWMGVNGISCDPFQQSCFNTNPTNRTARI